MQGILQAWVNLLRQFELQNLETSVSIVIAETGTVSRIIVLRPAITSPGLVLFVDGV